MLKIEREKHSILVKSKRKLTSDAVTCLYTLVLDLGCEAGFTRLFKRVRKRQESSGQPKEATYAHLCSLSCYYFTLAL